jgi:arrestin-related trafficking adapter 9
MADVVFPMPLDTLFTHPSPDVPRSKSILSRFASPLQKHARNMFELAVEPEDPFREYGPGDTVKGHVVLTVTKGFDITHLVVALHGYAKVFKHQVTSGEGLGPNDYVINGKGSRGFEYHGNGLASLFQEEQILCGSGFLKKQVYKFAFEVQFPTRSMPSTIEFERGTVTYTISATLTRPVTMIPTHTVFKTVKFKDALDIEPMNTPKSRVISLEPVSKRGKVKRVKPPPSIGTGDTSSRGHLTRSDTQTSTAASVHATAPAANPPLSPAPSEDTIATTVTTSSTSFRRVELDSQNRKKSDDTRSTTTSSSGSTVTAVAELQKHGALPGDSIPVRVSVTHTKPYVKGVVIATLYRVGRIDMHPAIPLANSKNKRQEYEDVYPKSRTGLGGLLFASASPNSVFRKDLSQSSTMMVVNPNTLTSDIHTTIKVPETAFPTIANVPGGMISFTYHIEVVVDLFGKLGETRFLPRLTSGEPTFTTAVGNSNQLTHEWSNSILDTTSLRRHKSVVTFELSVTIGTKDSSRNKKPAPLSETQPTNGEPPEAYDAHDWGQDGGEYWYYDENGQPQYYDPYYYEGWDGYDGWYDENQYAEQGQLSHHPPPPENIAPLVAGEEVDEKTRLRRQEELLMPTRPPQDGEASSSRVATAPTAPVLDDISHDAEQARESITTPSTPGPPASVASARSGDTVRPYGGSPPPPPHSSDPDSNATEDKQELERRRIMAQASKPPALEGQPGASSSAPSAPVLPDDGYIHIDGHDQDHELPQYQR